MRRLCGIATLVVVAVSASGCAAGIVNKPPSDVTETSATVHGIVWTTDGGEVAYWVEYGTTTAYGQETAQRTTKLAEDTPHDVSIPLDGLTPSTTWHYRICAQDAQARTCSKDATLFTGDSVTGRGLAGGLWAFKFDAHSGPSGENPTGTAFWGHGPSLIFEGPVTCLAVAGNRAVIGMDSSISPLLLYALDSPGGDKATFELVNEAPTTCPPPLDSDFEGASSVGLGDIVVTDVDPQPTSHGGDQPSGH